MNNIFKAFHNRDYTKFNIKITAEFHYCGLASLNFRKWEGTGFDNRKPAIVKTFEGIHMSEIS